MTEAQVLCVQLEASVNNPVWGSLGALGPGALSPICLTRAGLSPSPHTGRKERSQANPYWLGTMEKGDAGFHTLLHKRKKPLC